MLQAPRRSGAEWVLLLWLTVVPVGANARAGDDLRETVPLDRIVRTNGREVKGTLIFMNEERVVVRVGSRDKEFARDEIASIQANLTKLPAALEKHTALKSGDIPGRLALAQDFAGSGLPLEARLLLWEVLVIDPDHVAAHEGLGHRKSGKRWRVPIESRWYPMDKANEIHAKFSTARHLATTHFDLKTNLPLKKALRVAWFLEATYLSLHELLGPELELYHVVEPMSTWVYADMKSFPKSIGTRNYFSASDRRTYVVFGDSNTHALVHEALHQILFFSGEVMGGRARFPGWLNEGLAEYMTGAVDWNGHVRGAEAVLEDSSRVHFRGHAYAKKGYGLKRTLNFADDDFHGSSRQAEKYSTAFALTHFLLHGDGPDQRAEFMSFFRGALEGKSSATHFKKALGIKKEKDFEQAWLAYSKSMAEG